MLFDKLAYVANIATFSKLVTIDETVHRLLVQSLPIDGKNNLTYEMGGVLCDRHATNFVDCRCAISLPQLFVNASPPSWMVIIFFQRHRHRGAKCCLESVKNGEQLSVLSDFPVIDLENTSAPFVGPVYENIAERPGLHFLESRAHEMGTD